MYWTYHYLDSPGTVCTTDGQCRLLSILTYGGDYVVVFDKGTMSSKLIRWDKIEKIDFGKLRGKFVKP